MVQNEAGNGPLSDPDFSRCNNRFILLARDIKLGHSTFALPFALLGAFMARPIDESWVRFGGQLLLVVICMVSARTVAMLSNRLLDRILDAKNPRTAGRALPSGRVAVRDAVFLLIWSACAFEVCCVVFGFAFDNWWPFLLSIPVLVWISSYPLLKRFTSLCHVYLGSSLAISPLAAALAVEPVSVIDQPALWLMGGFVLCWVAGFDIVYALQDVETDREQKLFSMPSRLGVGTSLWISRGFHCVGVLCLAGMIGFDDRLGWLFGVGVAAVILLLIVEHVVSRGGTTARIQLAFFTLNGVISCVLGGLGIWSVVG